MAKPKRRQYKLSASFISAFKACPMRAYLGYIEGIRPERATEAQRIGTNYHTGLELLSMEPGSVCRPCGNLATPDPDCIFCVGNGFVREGTPIENVWAWLDEKYHSIPVGVDPGKWHKEKAILANAIACYSWLYENDGVEVVAREQQFNLALENPSSGRALPDVRIVGKIDKIVKFQNRLYVMEHKSTSKSIDADSSYWSRLALDVQPSIYVIAARSLGFEVEGVMYDVWHKPQISPKLLTQADTKKFLTDGEYYGEEFAPSKAPSSSVPDLLYVDDELCEFKPGKKEGTGQIRESSGMYGARLRSVMAEEPDKYFARKEIARTDDDLVRCATEIVNIYQTMRILEKKNAWWRDDTQCEATFRCQYTPICYSGVDCSKGFTPENFRRLSDAYSKENTINDEQ